MKTPLFVALALVFVACKKDKETAVELKVSGQHVALEYVVDGETTKVDHWYSKSYILNAEEGSTITVRGHWLSTPNDTTFVPAQPGIPAHDSITYYDSVPSRCSVWLYGGSDYAFAQGGWVPPGQSFEIVAKVPDHD